MEQFDRAQMARRFADGILAKYGYDYTGPDKERVASLIIIAHDAYALADAMLAEENKRKEPTNG